MLYNSRRSFIILICGFAVLEINVGVLSRAHLVRVLGIERARLEFLYVVHIDEREHFVVVYNVDFAHFVARSETVEEMKERNFRFERGKVSYER